MHGHGRDVVMDIHLVTCRELPYQWAQFNTNISHMCKHQSNNIYMNDLFSIMWINLTIHIHQTWPWIHTYNITHGIESIRPCIYNIHGWRWINLTMHIQHTWMALNQSDLAYTTYMDGLESIWPCKYNIHGWPWINLTMHIRHTWMALNQSDHAYTTYMDGLESIWLRIYNIHGWHWINLTMHIRHTWMALKQSDHAYTTYIALNQSDHAYTTYMDGFESIWPCIYNIHGWPRINLTMHIQHTWMA